MGIMDLYNAAREADKAYTIELRRVYGRDACSARYRFTHEDPECMAAALRKQEADDRWRNAYRDAR